VLRHLPLELLGEQALGRVVAGAGGALAQVRGQRQDRLAFQPRPLLVQQGLARRPAVHRPGHGV